MVLYRSCGLHVHWKHTWKHTAPRLGIPAEKLCSSNFYDSFLKLLALKGKMPEFIIRGIGIATANLIKIW